MDQDLRQGVKALANTVRAVRKGGVMITLVRAEAGVGVFGLANKKLPLGRKALKLLAPLLCAHVEPGGWLVLAGILERQADELIAAYAPWLALSVADREDGWILMTARRSPA
jgi:hypothetical protein